MNKSILAAALLTLGLTGAALAQSTQPRGGMDTLTFEQLLNIADKNKDTMVTRQEFLDAMGKAYDMKMEKFKTMKDDKMMKGDAMTRDGMKSLVNDIHHGA